MQHFFKRRKNLIIWAVVISFFVGGVGLIGLNQAGVFNRSSTGDEGPTLAATVNGTRIPREILGQATTNLFNQYQQYYQQIGQDASSLLAGASGALFRIQLQAQALQGLIRDALYAQEAGRLKIRVDSSTVNAAFAEQYNGLLERNNISEDQLAAYLQGQGSTLNGFKESLREQVAGQLRNQALREHVAGVIAPTDDDLEAYFEKNVSRYDRPEEIRASHILVADEQTAQDLLDQLNTGADFAELAKEHSTDTASAEKGGDLDWFTRGRMVREFEDAAFALEVGEISDIIKTQYGYHIIKLTDRKVHYTPTLGEVKDQVRDDYIEEIRDERFTAWYEEISKQAQLEVNLPLVNAYLKQQEDLDLGLAEFERLYEEGASDDPYLPYYIGRIYEQKMTAAVQDKASLEAIKEEVQASHILVLDEKKAMDLLDKLAAGADFAELAKEYSEDAESAENGGDLGWIERGAMAPEFEEAAFALEVGAISEIVETEAGLHIIKVTDRKEGPTEDQLTQIEELTQSIGDYKAKAVAAYIETLEEVEADEDFLNRILSLDPDSTTAIYLYGKLLVERGDAFNADMRFREAINKDPTFAAAYIASGDVSVELRNFQPAIDQYVAALELRPEDMSVMTKLAAVYLTLKRLDEAEKLLATIEQHDPENLKLVISQGDLAYERMLAVLSEREELEGKPERTVEEDARMEELVEAIASFYETAVTRYEQAYARSGTTDLTVKLGRAHLAFGELEKAEKAFGEVLVRSPYKAEAHEGMADVLRRQGDTEGAIEKYRTAFLHTFDNQHKQRLAESIVELAPDDLEMRLRLAKVYADQYMWSAAIKQYAAVLDVKPDSLEAYRGLGEAYKWRTEYATAIEYLQRALTYATSNSDKVELYEAIVEVNQSEVGQGKPLSEAGLEALFALAQLYLDQGNEESAKEKLEKIASDDPAYRPDEVAALLAKVSGEEPISPSLEEEVVVQTPSETVPISDDGS